jgi:SPOR domain
MRDEFEDEYYTAEEDTRQDWRGRLTERLSTWFGAGLAILLIGGLVFWGYSLGQRDATAVPIIRAALGPAKMQPDDPGGAVIAHQNISSYSADDAKVEPSQITIAPPPERPSEEDVTMGALQENTEEPAGDISEVAPTVGPDPAPGKTAGDSTNFAPEASPVARTRPAELSRQKEPAELSPQKEVVQQAASEDAELASRAAASVVQIQLGAYPNRALTKSEWTRIYRANEDILSGRALVVQSTISGGRRFFRLRAGPFKDRIEAQNVCRALQSRGQDCLVAVNG